MVGRGGDGVVSVSVVSAVGGGGGDGGDSSGESIARHRVAFSSRRHHVLLPASP